MHWWSHPNCLEYRSDVCTKNSLRTSDDKKTKITAMTVHQFMHNLVSRKEVMMRTNKEVHLNILNPRHNQNYFFCIIKIIANKLNNQHKSFCVHSQWLQAKMKSFPAKHIIWKCVFFMEGVGSMLWRSLPHSIEIICAACRHVWIFYSDWDAILDGMFHRLYLLHLHQKNKLISDLNHLTKNILCVAYWRFLTEMVFKSEWLKKTKRFEDHYFFQMGNKSELFVELCFFVVIHI